jgi:ribonuclease E
LALSVLRLIEEEALKDNTSQVLAIVPVPIASYLLNEKRRSVNHIERVQDVKITVVPDSDMETPHFEVVRVREGEELDLLSYLLPRKMEALKEAESKEPSEVEAKPRKVEQPALQGFAAPTQNAPAPTPKAKAKPEEAKPSQPGLVSRLFKAITGLFSSPEAEVEKTQQKEEKQQDNRGNRQRRNRNDQRRRGNKESRDNDRNRNRRKPAAKEDTVEESRDNTEARKPQNRRNKQNDRRGSNKKRERDEATKSKVEEQGQQLATEAQAEKKVVRNEEKAAKVKERRQRRKLTKQIRVKDQAASKAAEQETKQAAVAKEVADKQKLDEAQPKTAQAETAQEEPKQRRNRRSPRHLRASGQRRRRGRDRRPNPFRLRSGGVASPEMSMGKVMPSYGIAKPAAKPKTAAEPNTVNVEAESQVQSVILGGFACPEMSMGKVIIVKVPVSQEAQKTEQKQAESKVKEEPQQVAQSFIENA